MLALDQLHAGLSGASPDITLPKSAGDDGTGPAILFADVSKSMLLHERLGDEAARKVIDKLLDLAAKAVGQHKGRVVKTIGDELLAVLPSADAAARAARDLLSDVDGCHKQAGITLGMHVGLHAGAFLDKGGDVFGDAVNVASRLAAYAHEGQILTSSASAGGISPLVRRSMRSLGPLDIRGRREQIQVEEIAWRDDEDGEITITEWPPERPARARLVVRLGSREWSVGGDVRNLTIGRDPCADIPVRTSEASRTHGSLEFRNGGFFYVDRSLNGSYVSFGDTGETLVRRSEVVLSGRGVIGFGQSAGEPGESMTFEVDSGH